MKEFDRSKSLQQLGWQDWGEAAYDSHIVTECHRLRNSVNFKSEPMAARWGCFSKVSVKTLPVNSTFWDPQISAPPGRREWS